MWLMDVWHDSWMCDMTRWCVAWLIDAWRDSLMLDIISQGDSLLHLPEHDGLIFMFKCAAASFRCVCVSVCVSVCVCVCHVYLSVRCSLVQVWVCVWVCVCVSLSLRFLFQCAAASFTWVCVCVWERERERECACVCVCVCACVCLCVLYSWWSALQPHSGLSHTSTRHLRCNHADVCCRSLLDTHTCLFCSCICTKLHRIDSTVVNTPRIFRRVAIVLKNYAISQVLFLNPPDESISEARMFCQKPTMSSEARR